MRRSHETSAISPIALSSLDDLVAAGNGLTVPAGAEWTVDFAKAKQAGLGIEVPLPAGTQVLDRIVVVGVRGSVSESENAADLADLLLSHRYSDGFGLLAQGTPTNNAEAERSPYKVSATPAAPPLDTGEPSADLARLASLIGLDSAAVERLLDPADSRPTLETTQQAANTALWFATWEPVLQRVGDAEVSGVTPATIESARRLHRDHVRGAGPAPVIRVGAQPYGILPVSDLDAWAPRSGDTTASLVPLIRRTLARWMQRASSLPRVRPGDSITDEALIEVLGTSPMGIGLRARPAVDGPNVSAVRRRDRRARAPWSRQTCSSSGRCSRSTRWMRRGSTCPRRYTTKRARSTCRSSRSATPRSSRAILADEEPKVDSVLQALLDLAWDDVKRKRFARRAGAVRPATSRPARAQVPRSRSSFATQPSGPTQRRRPRSARPFLRGRRDRCAPCSTSSRQPIEQLSIAAIEPVAEAQTSLAQVALDLGDTVQAKWIGSQAICRTARLVRRTRRRCARRCSRSARRLSRNAGSRSRTRSTSRRTG